MPNIIKIQAGQDFYYSCLVWNDPTGDDAHQTCPTQVQKGVHSGMGDDGFCGDVGYLGAKGDVCPSSVGPDGAPGIPGVNGEKGTRELGPQEERGEPGNNDIAQQELDDHKSLDQL